MKVARGHLGGLYPCGVGEGVEGIQPHRTGCLGKQAHSEGHREIQTPELRSAQVPKEG